MAEIVNCPQCERKLKVPESLLGKPVKCPTCGATFTAGGADTDPLGRVAPPPVEEDAGYDVVPDEQPREKVSARRRPADRDEEEEEEEDERPQRRRRRSRRDLTPHRGTLILVLGILSLVICGLMGPFAWVMGNNDLAEIRAGRMDPEGEGTTQAGRICGMISSILMMLGCGIYCLVFVIIGIGGVAGR